MAQNSFKCPGDCLKCKEGQRLYCSSQNSYQLVMMMMAMQETVNGLKAKVEALQSKDDAIFNPFADEEEIEAQCGDGAEE